MSNRRLATLAVLSLCLNLAAPPALAQSELMDALKNQAGSLLAPASPAPAAAAAGPASAAAAASPLGGAAAGLLGQVGLPAMGQSTMGNVAGVLEYCIKHKYLAGGDAQALKNKLLGKITGQKEQETGFASGAKGLLQGGDGKTLNLQGISGSLKDKACDYVLSNAGSLL